MFLYIIKSANFVTACRIMKIVAVFQLVLLSICTYRKKGPGSGMCFYTRNINKNNPGVIWLKKLFIMSSKYFKL